MKACDEIIVMKDGAIAEHGSHDELLINGKEYANLVTLFTEEQEASMETTSSAPGPGMKLVTAASFHGCKRLQFQQKSFSLLAF